MSSWYRRDGGGGLLETIDNVDPVIGRYVLRAKLGEGGMAEVFLADLLGTKGFRRQVVLKVLKEHHLHDAHQQEMFSDEARVGSRIEHPNVPRTFELGEHEGRPYIVQEYVEGPSFTEVLSSARQQGGIDLRLGVRVVIDVARALHHAWHLEDRDGKPLRVVHRDVSPSNILVSRRGITKLIDFGVARFDDREAETENDVLKGKLRYLAPETVRGGEVSHRSDLFALGVVLYQATVGRSPWRSGTDLGKRLRGEFEHPTAVASDFPPELETIILRCLALEPTERFQHGEDLAQSLELWLQTYAGGRVTDATMSAWVHELFPGGTDDWLPRYDLEAMSVGHSSSTYTLAPHQPQPQATPAMWGAALAAAAAIGLVIVGLIGVVIRQQQEVAEIRAIQERARVDGQDRRDFEVLLQHADTALDRRQVQPARHHLEALAALPVTDAALLARRDQMAQRLEVVTQARAIFDRAKGEPQAARGDAQALLAAHPDHPDVERLLADLKAMEPPTD